MAVFVNEWNYKPKLSIFPDNFGLNKLFNIKFNFYDFRIKEKSILKKMAVLVQLRQFLMKLILVHVLIYFIFNFY